MSPRLAVTAFGVLVVLVFASTEPGLAAGNGVTAGRVGRITSAIVLNDLKPAACTNGTPANLITGSVVITGTNQRDLILGSALVDAIDGRQQNDCIVGGDLADVIDGFNGTDVCIGGPGIDVFIRCETAIQ